MVDHDDVPFLMIHQDLKNLCYEASLHSDPDLVMREFFEMVLAVLLSRHVGDLALVQVMSLAARRVTQEAALSR